MFSFSELCSYFLDSSILGFRYNKVNIDNEEELDDHEDDKDIWTHYSLKRRESQTNEEVGRPVDGDSNGGGSGSS